MIYAYLSGFSAALSLVAALFFLRFWTHTREVLFLFFAGAFVLLAISPTLVGLHANEPEEGWEFTFRLAAFLLIIVGIVWTNIRSR